MDAFMEAYATSINNFKSQFFSSTLLFLFNFMCHASLDSIRAPVYQNILGPCYPWYLGITRRSCLEAHMVLDMEYRERIDLSMALEGPSFLFLSQTYPVSSTSLHHYWPGLASERTLAPWGNWSEVSWYVSYLIIITFLYMH
jgi:hypothetical protein